MVSDSNPFISPSLAAHRLISIEPFHVMEVQRRANELERNGIRIIHMEIGQPDFGAPPAIVEAGIAALQTQPLGYTDALGIPELRAALSNYYRDRIGVSVPRERIVVTAGASAALLLCLGALVNPGDEVLMADPSYPCYRHFVGMFEGVPTGLPVDESQNYQLSLSDVEAHWSPRSKGVILASPSNPTGTTVDTDTLRGIVKWVRSRGGFIIVDEIYQGLVYEGNDDSALSDGDDVFVINSFSKYFCMTGWRLGWAVVPEYFLKPIEKLAQNFFICPSAPAQFAALGGFGNDTFEILDGRRDEYRRRRDAMLPRLREMGFSIPITPSGAFYIYAGCEKFSHDSLAFSKEVLEKAGVAVTPGVDFGRFRANQFVRLSYTRSQEELAEGLDRLSAMLGRQRG